MSKSDPSDFSRINLTDNKDLIAQKIKKAKTDPYPLPISLDELKERPEALNLINIYAALSDNTPDEIIAEYGGKEFAFFKPKLTELAIEQLAPISEKMKELKQDKKYIDTLLDEGSAKAAKIANPILDEVFELFGLIRKNRRY